LALALGATAAHAADTAQARAARYYADGLEHPLMQLRRGACFPQKPCSGDRIFRDRPVDHL